jgi:hypothetical protein
MRTWMIWTENPVDESALRCFAESQGGRWNDALGDEAVIERGDGAIFIGVVPNAADALPDDVEFATERLGAEPASMLSMRVGHGVDSIPLAESVAARAVTQWGGFLDRNEPLPKGEH